MIDKTKAVLMLASGKEDITEIYLEYKDGKIELYECETPEEVLEIVKDAIKKPGCIGVTMD
jgi:leucyl aminopeptidase (aminopeptidase T)